MTPQEFVAKWRPSTLKERSGSQEHFIDLCRMLGHETPAQADSEGTWFTFEKGADKSTGGQGWADVWKKGHFAWEYKGKHKDLDAAYAQLLRYCDALLNPPLLVVSDMETIVVRTNFNNAVKRELRIGFDDLTTEAGQATLRAVFTAPDTLRSEETPEGVTKKAAAEFAKLAESLRRRGADSEDAAHFLIRILFCLFAEDIKLLPDKLLSRLVADTRDDPATFRRQLKILFGHMAKGGFFGLDKIPHFNGGLFDDDTVLDLTTDDLRALEKASQLDWSSIEPSILGTLFERGLDPGKRSQIGAHYTSREDILLIVEPVLMRPLRRRWDEVRSQAEDIAAEWRAAPAAGGVKGRLRKRFQELIYAFADELANTKILDPACGSGNFLYVALKQLLDLENEVIGLSARLGFGYFFPFVSPEQLYGIEINEYAHELAQATVWIGYIQWLRDNGHGTPAEPILKKLDNIEHKDAILAFDEDGNPTEPEWPEATVVIGNPPFLGSQRLRSELGDEYVDHLFSLYRERLPGTSDLCCYWFEKARAMISAGRLTRAGLLATQGIRGRGSRRVLERIKESGDILWAQSDRDWILDGAAVHVSMVGFDDGGEMDRELDGLAVRAINADLTSGSDLTEATPLRENANLCFQGPVKVGRFDIPDSLAQEMLARSGNPNGRPNSDVVRPWVNASDLGGRSRQMWIIDFGEMSLDVASGYESPLEYVRLHVKPARDNNRRERRRNAWWLHGETVPGLRAAVAGKPRFIATPRVAKHRLFVWVNKATLPDTAVVAIARGDDYFFGLLHSRVHEAWARRAGTQVREAESGFRYTPMTCFETFPFPWPPGKEPVDDPRVQAIAAAAKDLVEKRDRWLNPEGASEADLKKRTLTNLYNQHPTWLDLAHKRLDDAVLDAYAWPHDLTDDQILESLLALNLKRARIAVEDRATERRDHVGD
ncbi:MAG: class I SAM-dependent DNA methyltransferase [Candidatus Bipolaricaulis sp.]|nr:class I SAM-dependent DNA methyltransferase [Candidatus Bipolaricaulis sp.]